MERKKDAIMEPMAKPHLFPIELYNNPVVQKLNVTEAGLFRILVEIYWKTGEPLPDSEYALVRATRAEWRTFRKCRARVYEALNVMMPLFIEQRKKREYNKLRQQKHAAIIRTKIKPKAQHQQTSFVDEKPHSAVLATPLSPGENWNRQDWFDLPARQKALKSKEKDDGATFTD